MANKKQKSVTIRISTPLCRLINKGMLYAGFDNVSEYYRRALIEQVSRDTGMTISDIMKVMKL